MDLNEIKIKNTKPILKKILVTVIIIALIIILVSIGLTIYFSHQSKTTKIGFEDIGELATQVSYCTEVNVTEASRDLWGITIPFTESKYIYSYDIIIKAGFNFEEIEWKENTSDYTIEVKLPEAKILSSEIDTDSFKVYHEDESIFRPISLEENNEALINLKQEAEENAISNGLLDNALDNAETVLTAFFANSYDLEKYEIKFMNK